MSISVLLKGQNLELVHQKDDFKGFPELYSINDEAYKLFPAPNGSYYAIHYNFISMQGFFIDPKREDPDIITTQKEAERQQKGKEVKATTADPFYGIMERDGYYRNLVAEQGGTALFYYNPFRGSLTLAQGYKHNPLSAYNYNFFGDFYEWYMIHDTKWHISNVGIRGFTVDASFDEMKLYSQFFNSPPVNKAAILLGEGNLALKVEPLEITHKLVISYDSDKIALLRGTKDFLEIAIATGLVANGCCSLEKVHLTKYYLPGNFSSSNNQSVNYAASFFDSNGNFWLHYAKTIGNFRTREVVPNSNFNIFNPLINPYFALKTINANEPEFRISLEKLRKVKANWMAKYATDGKVFLNVGINNKVNEEGALQLDFVNVSTGKVLDTEKLDLPFKVKKAEDVRILPNPYTRELLITIAKQGYAVYSYNNIFNSITEADTTLVQNYDQEMYPSSTDDEVELPDGSVLTGRLKYGYRNGEWLFTNGDTHETWTYDMGYRTDDKFIDMMAPLKEKYDEQVKTLFGRNLKELYEAYQQKVKDRAAFTKAFTSAAGSFIGGEIGTKFLDMDITSSMEFGRALAEDLSTGQLNSLNNFFSSYAGANGVNSVLPENSANESGNSPSKKSGELAGTWVTTSGNIELTLGASGSGQLIYKNIGVECGGDQIVDFNWTSTDTALTLEYTAMSICGEKTDTPKSDGAKSYQLKGSTLNWAGATWHRE